MAKNIIFSHPTGNANSRAVVEALYQCGGLDSFHTSVASFPTNLVGLLSSIPPLKEFSKRSYLPELRDYTHQYPIKELGRILSSKFKMNNWIEKEKGIFSVDAIYNSIDRNVAKYIKNNNIAGVYAYEDGALESFLSAKNKNISCFYDLPIGYWRSMHELLREEKDKNPDWAITLGGFGDSDKKLNRKDEELALADAIFVASSFTKKTLELFPGNLAPIHVIPYGFPTPNFERKYSNNKKNKLKVLYVGGLSQRKGISYLFEAVKGLEDFIELTVVGKGNIDACSPLANELNKHNYIPSLAHPQILELMAQNDIFVFPSLFEGFGLVITEAMSQGTPVITTDRTCGPDIITDEKDGWLIPSGQSFAIKERLEMILQDRALCEEVGRNAMRKAESRTWSNYGNETIKILMEK